MLNRRNICLLSWHIDYVVIIVPCVKVIILDLQLINQGLICIPGQPHGDPLFTEYFLSSLCLLQLCPLCGHTLTKVNVDSSVVD